MIIRRKKIRNYVDDSRENSALEVDDVEDIVQEHQQIQPPEQKKRGRKPKATSTQVNSSVPVAVQPKKRGRKPKKANENEAKDAEPVERNTNHTRSS